MRRIPMLSRWSIIFGPIERTFCILALSDLLIAMQTR
jgi:hypothetical protein